MRRCPNRRDAQLSPGRSARDTVLSAYRGFSPQMADIAERFFDEGWIDAPVRPGKAPGAFAHPTTPSAHPYVLVNYLGKPRDVMTLAHELGHGVHQVLAAPNGALMAPTPLTLAETASVFGEMLTFRALLAQTDSDPAERKAMLASKVEDMLNTVVRQIAFYQFERRVHTERSNGELTAERIGEFWMSVQSESLGPAIGLRSGLRDLLGLYPPFHPFAVLRLRLCLRRLPGELALRRLRGRPRGFAERYLAMLAAGGSKPYSELLEAVRAGREGPGVLAARTFADRAHDRRTGGDGVGSRRALRRFGSRFEPFQKLAAGVRNPNPGRVRWGGDSDMMTHGKRPVSCGLGELHDRPSR